MMLNSLEDYIRALGRVYDKEGWCGYIYRDLLQDIYVLYQSSALWRDVVSAVKERDGRLCTKCGEMPKKGVVHHLSYQNWGKGDQEEIDDCTYLCVPCHNKEHRNMTVEVPFWANRNNPEVRLEILKAAPLGEL